MGKEIKPSHALGPLIESRALFLPCLFALLAQRFPEPGFVKFVMD